MCGLVLAFLIGQSQISFAAGSLQQITECYIDDVDQFLPSDEEVVRVYFIRHGESVLNLCYQGVKYGRGLTVELTEKGHRQARELRDRLLPRMQNLQPRIVTSPAKRAMDTAESLLQVWGQTALIYEEFVELGSGPWEGASKEDIEYLKEYKIWRDLSAKQKFAMPKVGKGESYAQVAARALDGLSKITAELQSDETVFIFSHYMLMNALALVLLDVELSAAPHSLIPDIAIGNCDIMLLEIPRAGSIHDAKLKAIIHTFVN